MPKKCLNNMIFCKVLLHTCLYGYETARLIAAFMEMKTTLLQWREGIEKHKLPNSMELTKFSW